MKVKPWRQILNESITDLKELSDHFPTGGLEKVVEKYPLMINPYYFSLIKKTGDPIYKQCVPDLKEIEHSVCPNDPFNEDSGQKSYIHRYPDRVLLKVSGRCALNCRHCMRKREIGKKKPENTDRAIEYIKDQKGVSEVILSGGDPFIHSTEYLEDTLRRLDSIDHIKTIRIHTRTLCTLPQRITERLLSSLGKIESLFIVTHFNHPDEITDTAENSCRKIIRKGIPVLCQTVLLKGVNNNPDTLKRLFKGLVKIKIKPYYIHHPDPVKGTGHFRLPLKEGLSIMKELRGNISGLCIPQYMLELPESGGKVPLIPEYIKENNKGVFKISNFQGRTFDYEDANPEE